MRPCRWALSSDYNQICTSHKWICELSKLLCWTCRWQTNSIDEGHASVSEKISAGKANFSVRRFIATIVQTYTSRQSKSSSTFSSIDLTGVATKPTKQYFPWITSLSGCRVSCRKFIHSVKWPRLKRFFSKYPDWFFPHVSNTAKFRINLNI